MSFLNNILLFYEEQKIFLNWYDQGFVGGKVKGKRGKPSLGAILYVQTFTVLLS